MAWHKGTWWPLYVKEWYAPKSSQHMFDPYSFCLLVLGLLFHLLWGTDNIDNWIFGFLLAIVLENILATPFRTFSETSFPVLLGTLLVQCLWQSSCGGSVWSGLWSQRLSASGT